LDICLLFPKLAILVDAAAIYEYALYTSLHSPQRCCFLLLIWLLHHHMLDARCSMLVDPKHHRAYVTRDYQQLIPGDPIALFQAAFMVIQPNVQVFDELVAIIKKGNFLPATGWDGLGWATEEGWEPWPCRAC
jgi:hypothetical protein